MKANTVKWLRGLISVAISSGCGGVAIVIVDPVAFNFTTHIGKLATVYGALALTHTAMYLTHSPLPDADPTQSAGPTK